LLRAWHEQETLYLTGDAGCISIRRIRRSIMARYIQFTAEDGSTFLVETDEVEMPSQGGVVKAGLKEVLGKGVAAAQTVFEQAVENVIQHNAKAFLQAVRNLPAQDQPVTMEVTFAIRATGEVGNTAVARGTGEANYTVKFTWKR